MAGSEASGKRAKGGSNPYAASASGKASAPSAPLLQGAALFHRGILYLVIAVVGCAADLVSKEMVFAWRGLPTAENEYWLWKGYVGIETSLNRGALFGMGAGFSSLFALLSLTAITGILVWLFIYRAASDRLLTVILAMITGGILGNLYDRLGLWSNAGIPPEFESYRYAVRDWILFRYKEHTWPNFNIADCLLVIGAGLMMYQSFRGGESVPAETVEPAKK